MAEIVKLLGVEVLVGAGESTTANRATLVRIHNPGAAVNVITVQDPLQAYPGITSYSGVGSMTMAAGGEVFLEKQPSYTVSGKADINVTQVGFTN
tara:strand:+ start:900 stop:1184 length:285 start_codon:yes stop_codon:yes gene_type:complete